MRDLCWLLCEIDIQRAVFLLELKSFYLRTEIPNFNLISHVGGLCKRRQIKWEVNIPMLSLKHVFTIIITMSKALSYSQKQKSIIVSSRMNFDDH